MPYDVSTFTYGRTGADVAAWIQRFIAKMTANGWVRASDTGQIDPTTIPPGATYTTHTNIGYAVFVLNDTYRATDPVYLTVTFWMYGVGGTGAVANIAPQTFCTLGFSTNGAGAIAGQSISLGSHTQASNAIALTFRSAVDIFAAGDGWATVAHGIGLAFNADGHLVRQAGFFQIQRERDINGLVIPGRLFIVYVENGRTPRADASAFSNYLAGTSRDNSSVRLLSYHLYKESGGTSAAVAAIPGIIGSANMAGSVNGVIQAQPSWMHLPQIRPATGVIAVPSSVFNAGTIFTASIDGVNEFKYSALGIGSRTAATPIGAVYAIDSFASDSYCIAVRVE